MTASDETTTDPALDVRGFMRSLTGFDEIAIEQQFRRPLEDLSNTGTVRALAFVQFRRDGLDDKAAHEKAMGATFGALDDMFDTSQVEGPKA